MNSDLVYHKKDKYGNLTPYSVDTTHIGKCIYTKSVGGTQPVDITLNYKNPEGDAEALPPAPTMQRHLRPPGPGAVRFMEHVSPSPPGGHVFYLQGAQKT